MGIQSFQCVAKPLDSRFHGNDDFCKSLRRNPPKIDAQFLDQFREFREFRAFRHTKEEEKTEGRLTLETTPEEALERAYQRLRDDLAGQLLQQIKTISPSLFEKIVVELLVKMGYGGSRQDAGKAIGKSGSVLIHLGIEFPYVHDITDLLTILEGKGHSISDEIREAGRLTRFAVDSHYPGLSEPITQNEYEKAIAIADAVVRWVEEILKRSYNPEDAETEQ